MMWRGGGGEKVRWSINRPVARVKYKTDLPGGAERGTAAATCDGVARTIALLAVLAFLRLAACSVSARSAASRRQYTSDMPRA